MSKKLDINDALKKLESIADWFEKEDEVDVEKGMEKVKEGVELIKLLRRRLEEVQNEFNEIKTTLD
ncbi:MAG: exodeoxyribonuclease VII small subunit [Candidatus Vogelbacteria bacterium]|nr:exodeoxyribonuclease VII small subunit [Candidatus Vogelbacteria bacterium]